jgi:hypothetical protein
MEPSQLASASVRSSREIPVARPRWAFSKGFMVGALIEVPVFSLAVMVLADLGIGDPEVGYLRILWLTMVFIGLAATTTAGGIGRLAASVTVERGRKRAVYQAARAHAAAGAALMVIAVIPHGHLPAEHLDWIWIGAAGVLPGALCGAVIGFVCSSASPVGLVDVWTLAAKPTGAIRQLLDPRDLVKLGNALRTRTSTLFEGIFEPAAPPPKTGEPPPADKPAEPKRDVPPSGPDNKP